MTMKAPSDGKQQHAIFGEVASVELERRLNIETDGFASAPHQPVKGTCVVMPLFGKEAYSAAGPCIALQFNGWSIELFSSGVWSLVDTAEEAAAQNAATETTGT